MMRAKTPTAAIGERVNQNDSCRYDPNHAEPHTHPAKALAKRRGPEHGHARGQVVIRCAAEQT